MKGFWKALFSTETPAERLHRRVMSAIQGLSDLAMVPEVREAIKNNHLAVIDLRDGDEESSMLMLDKDEQCLFFA